ncbi:MAG: phosphatase PAP2 family protein [Candidatus Magasanikbacteria bacterium]|nr:phosphatase PAP2 family protein [Candidatus Magasanikbacteria bacterium]
MSINYVIIFGATYLIFVIALVAVFYFLFQPRARKKDIIIFIAVTVPIIYLLSFIASGFYYNSRPFVVGHFVPLVFHGNTNGFPSDHTLASAAMAVIIFRSNKKLGVILLLLALLVGISRVLAGVHHAVDVFASLVIAVIVGWLSNQFIFAKVKTYFINK